MSEDVQQDDQPYRLENIHNDPRNFVDGQAPEPTDFAEEYRRRSNVPDSLAGGGSPAARASGEGSEGQSGPQGDYDGMKKPELEALARDRGIDTRGMKVSEIRDELRAADGGTGTAVTEPGSNPGDQTVANDPAEGHEAVEAGQGAGAGDGEDNGE